MICCYLNVNCHELFACVVAAAVIFHFAILFQVKLEIPYSPYWGAKARFAVAACLVAVPLSPQVSLDSRNVVVVVPAVVVVVVVVPLTIATPELAAAAAAAVVRTYRKGIVKTESATAVALSSYLLSKLDSSFPILGE